MAYNPSVDALSDILRTVRLASSVWSTARLTAPFAVRTKGSSASIFHVVTRGRAWLIPDLGGEPCALGPGDVVLLPRGDGHVLADEPTRLPMPLAELGRESTDEGAAIPCVVHGGAGEETFIICGTFRMDHAASESLLALLPRILHVADPKSGMASWIEGTLGLMEREIEAARPGVESVLARLADVLFVQVIRASFATIPAERAGWLAAVHDPQIGRALALIHESPGERWSADSLAKRVGMSRSTFFERFTGLVGESPAQYLTKWRVFAAADLLDRTNLATTELANRVGYRSDDSFGRAFKKHFGMTPSQYRARATAVSSREAS
jgi:AraC-like DNA-binding protein